MFEFYKQITDLDNLQNSKQNNLTFFGISDDNTSKWK